MKRIITIIICSIFLCFISCSISETSNKKTQNLTIINGVTDFSTLSLDKPVNLDGQWGFYWSRFVDPSSFESKNQPLADTYVNFPSEWTNYKVNNIQKNGFATYNLRINGLSKNGLYAIKTPTFCSAAYVYANGELVQKHGRPGQNFAEEQAFWNPQISLVKASENGTLDLVLHISNFNDKQGGSHNSIRFGLLNSIINEKERIIANELFVMGVIWAIGAWYLAYFFFRKQDKSAFWFASLCFFLGLRVICYDEYFILSLFPNMSWKVLYTIGYFTMTFAVPLFFLFIRATFKNEMPKFLVYIVIGIAAVYSGIVLFLPTSVSSFLLFPYQITMLLSAIVALASIVLAIIHKRAGAWIFCLGLLCMVLSLVYDVLVANGLIQGSFSQQFGLAGFMFALSLILTRRLAGAFTLSEKMSENLSKLNKSLERFVPREFLSFLHKTYIEEIELGDSSAEEMAIMFVDIKSFTSLAEKLSPEETFSFINSFLERVCPAVRDYGGFIDKYMGDGFMALFNSGAEKALLCALDIKKHLASFNKERLEQNKFEIEIGIGLHFGRLMLGTIGETLRMDGTVLSDAVNLASRLEGVSKKHKLGIAVSETIIASLPDPTLFRMRFIGKLHVKGKKEPVSVFEIYDGDKEEIISQKDKIRSSYERAVEAWSEQQYEKAETLFKQVLTVLPNDSPTKLYLDGVKTRKHSL